MAHKGEKEGYQIKTLKFKVRSHDIGKSLYDIVNEYTNYYNKVSKWICYNLDTPIGELSKNISEKRHNSKYYRATNDPNWKNEPMWKIFTKKFSNGETFSEQGKNTALSTNNSVTTLTPRGRIRAPPRLFVAHQSFQIKGGASRATRSRATFSGSYAFFCGKLF